MKTNKITNKDFEMKECDYCTANLEIFSWTSGHFGAFFFQFFFFWAPLYENLEIFWVTKWPKTLTLLVGSLSQREARRTDAKQGEQPKRLYTYFTYEHGSINCMAPSSNHQKLCGGGGGEFKGGGRGEEKHFWGPLY